ncbi:MAG: hypothetical protein E6G07_10195 [Actinobacteria bacterium]|nr:MAG: hypothetical protein E6G53_11430 [Actinomycetota bacterium]TML78162.1 MAG: hypothetical protein E6G07_10195 [Actinomycetota bacterium]
MPPDDRPIPRFIAEPPQEALPYGRWADALAERFLAECRRIDSDEDLGEPGDVIWFPDRSYGGRTYVPATAPTSTGFEVFGYVSFTREHEGAEAADFFSVADFTDETADANPDWRLDLSDQEIASWRGPQGRRGEIALVWGVALEHKGLVVTAELGPTTTDQCALMEDRFTLVSLDAYTGDYLEVVLWGSDGREIAAESLYADEDDGSPPSPDSSDG